MRQSGPPGPPGFAVALGCLVQHRPEFCFQRNTGTMSGQGEGALFQHQRTGLQFSMSSLPLQFGAAGPGRHQHLGLFQICDSAGRDHRIAVHPAVGVQQAHPAPLRPASPAPVCRACGRRSSSTITFIRNKESRGFSRALRQPEKSGLHEGAGMPPSPKASSTIASWRLAIGFQICDAVGDMAGHGIGQVEIFAGDVEADTVQVHHRHLRPGSAPAWWRACRRRSRSSAHRAPACIRKKYMAWI